MHSSDYSPESKPALKEILRNTSRPLWLLLLLALLLPALIAGVLAWQRHTEVLAETKQAAQRSVIALEQHLGSVLQTHALMLRQILDQTQGRSWEEIASDEDLERDLARLTSQFRHVAWIGIVGPQGNLRVASSGKNFSPPINIADRDYFVEQQNGTARGPFFSAPFTGRISNTRLFAISMPRMDAAGEFDGIVAAGIPLDYFSSFWDQFAPSGGYLIPLMRADGTMLLRYPTNDMPERLDPNGPFVSHTRESSHGIYTAQSLVDGVERINAYRQVNDYPLYISFSVETDTALREWRDEMLPVLVLALLATIGLVTLSLVVIRRAYQQRQIAARWHGIAVDLKSEIARREAAEEKLHQAQKMEAFGQLTGGLAHDFNNMLAGIAGNLELIRIRLARGEPEAIAHCVDRADAVIAKAAQLIQRLLSFARRKTLKAVPVPVNNLIRSASDMLQDAVGAHIHIETDLPASDPVALCDPAQLESALLNLVINARHAMPEGGRIMIRASIDTPLDAARAGGDELGSANNGNAAGAKSTVTISVSDTGTGMSQAVLDKAFEPFFTTKGIGEGSGLGLPMVLGFVQQSGGQVRIDSVVNGGTKVTFTLPAYQGGIEDVLPCNEQSVSDTVAVAGTVLVVEDDVAVRQVLVEVLQRAGATVLQAGDANEAVRLLAANPDLDLVVTDIGLPGELNGYQLSVAIRSTRPESRFLFISGFSGGGGVAESVIEPQDRVLAKPFKMNAFLETLAEMQQDMHGKDDGKK